MDSAAFIRSTGIKLAHFLCIGYNLLEDIQIGSDDPLVQLRDFSSPFVRQHLGIMLTDQTRAMISPSKSLHAPPLRQQIVWATEPPLGTASEPSDPLDMRFLLGPGAESILPRIMKDGNMRQVRTKKLGEVFTPAWLCCLMVNQLDQALFPGETNFAAVSEMGWQVSEDPIPFQAKADWQRYVTASHLELCCGEAPFLVSRYDAATGMPIPVAQRMGILDRKLRVVGENTSNKKTWGTWVKRAYQSVYGYEMQGDSLLLARINLLLSLVEHCQHRWGENPPESLVKEIAKIISWNVFQMDGLTGNVPHGQEEVQTDLLQAPTPAAPMPARVMDWATGRSFSYNSIKEMDAPMKFDFIIGNPPYQEETIGENDTYAPPVYHMFLNDSYKVSDRVLMVHPARFLFHAGATPKAWNEKMLQDPHLKVLFYEPVSGKVFPGTDIKGGIAVTYRDVHQYFGAIEVFTAFPELNDILSKVEHFPGFQSFSTIVVSRTSYRLTDEVHRDEPTAIHQLSQGHAYDMSTNIFERLPQIFFDDNPGDEEYVQVHGLIKNNRVTKWMRRRHLRGPGNFVDFKVILPKSNGSGAIGEVLSTPLIGLPLIGHTESFISIGSFPHLQEAEACLKYVKTKFARTMLGVLKITQDNPPEKWRYVPLQDFTPSSDIVWTQPIPAIDRQLYEKYGLTDAEVTFIETHVKEMA